MRMTASAAFLISLPFTMTHSLAEDPFRESELVRIEEEIQAQRKEAEDQAADLLPRQKVLRDKVAQKEKILQELARRRRITGPTAQALEKLRSELRELDVQIKDRQWPYLQRQEDLEQERRRIVRKFPEPGDPTYLEVAGKLYTREEWDLEKSMEPGIVAEQYVQELLGRRIIRSAKQTTITKDEQFYATPGPSRLKDVLNVNYTVEYVSKGGVVNERKAWVTVLTRDGIHWEVSPGMKEVEIMGGLP